MVDCLLEQRGNESGSNGFPSAKVSIPGFGWVELVLLCSHVALDRNVGISVVSFDRRRALNHSLDAWQVSPQETNDERLMMSYKWQRAKNK